MCLVRASHRLFCNSSTWGFHPPPVTFCPVLVTSCSSFSLSIATGHEQRGQLEKDHSSKAVRWKIWKTEALAIITPNPLLLRHHHHLLLHLPSTPLFPKCSKLPQFDWQTDFVQEPVPIPVRVYWRWFWSPPRGHSSSHAICHLDCMVDSRGGVLWLLIVYRLRCFRLHKDHMHGARWWACTLIMSLYLCAGRSATIRSPWGTSLLSPTMLFFHKYSLLQLSLTSLIKNTNSSPPWALFLQVHTNTQRRWEIMSDY